MCHACHVDEWVRGLVSSWIRVSQCVTHVVRMSRFDDSCVTVCHVDEWSRGLVSSWISQCHSVSHTSCG